MDSTRLAVRERSRARLRPRPRPTPRFDGLVGGSDATWIDLGNGVLRLRGDDGDVIGSIALPDAQAGLGRLEFAARELETLEPDEADNGGSWT